MHGFFLIICMKLQQDKYLKLTQIIFWEKLCFEVFGPKEVQNEVFTVLAKTNAWNFSDLLHEVAAA